MNANSKPFDFSVVLKKTFLFLHVTELQIAFVPLYNAHMRLTMLSFLEFPEGRDKHNG
jgi:hypothetical protein